MFYREKAYTRINWKNRPNLSTPLGAKNLNKMDATINELDDRIIEVSSEVEMDSLTIGFISDKVNALEEDVDENTSRINELSSLAEDVNGLKIVNTASGTTAYMDDASNMNIEDITFYGESTQNGEPTPTNPILIESTVVNRIDVMRKNLLQNTANDIERIGLTYTMQSDGSVKVVGTTTEADYQVLIGQVTLPKGSYILSGAPNNICRLRIAKGDNSTLLGHDLGSGFSFTLEEESTVFVSVRTQSTVGTNINVVYYPMIRPSFFTDGTYEPYQSQTVNLSAPIELNGIGGVRDTDKVKKFGVVVFDGSDDELWYLTDTNTENIKRPAINSLKGKIKIPQNNSEVANVLCTQFKSLSANRTYTLNEGISIQGVGDGQGQIQIYSERFNTADISLWKAHLQDNPMTVVYELAEPIETELPQADIDAIKNLHTYKPNTVVMNDADAEMDVQYVADPRLYIDKKFEALASAIVNQ